MKRRALLSLVLAMALVVVTAVPAGAANPTVSITVRAQTISITNTQNTWGLGEVVVSESYKWGSSDTYSTVTNTGNVNVDVTIRGTDCVAVNTTFNWVLADTSVPGDQIYGLNATITSTYNIIVKKTEGGGFNELVSDLPHTALNTQDWSMTFYTPTAFHAEDDGLDKSATVTLVASKA